MIQAGLRGAFMLARGQAHGALLVEDTFYLRAALKSLAVAGVSSALCLLIGYPMALAIARAP